MVRDLPRPCLYPILEIWNRVLYLEYNTVSAELWLVWRHDPASAVVVQLHQREQRLIQLLSFLLGVVFIVGLLGKSELMQG